MPAQMPHQANGCEQCGDRHDDERDLRTCHRCGCNLCLRCAGKRKGLCERCAEAVAELSPMSAMGAESAGDGQGAGRDGW